MITGHFYFIKDDFYDCLPDCGLMSNKETDPGGSHCRPCHYCFEYDGFYWMIPISSKVVKYKSIFQKKIERQGICDTICFGFVNGHERAFLIQNAFPVTKEYIDSEYRVNHNTVPVVVKESLSKELNKHMRKVIRLRKRGTTLTFTDIDRIIAFLSSDN